MECTKRAGSSGPSSGMGRVDEPNRPSAMDWAFEQRLHNPLTRGGEEHWHRDGVRHAHGVHMPMGVAWATGPRGRVEEEGMGLQHRQRAGARDGGACLSIDGQKAATAGITTLSSSSSSHRTATFNGMGLYVGSARSSGSTCDPSSSSDRNAARWPPAMALGCPSMPSYAHGALVRSRGVGVTGGSCCRGTGRRSSSKASSFTTYTF